MSLYNLIQKIKNNPKSNETLNLNSRVLLVDGLNLFLRSFAVFPAMDDNGEHVGGIVGFLKSLASIITNIQPTKCIVIFDGKGGSLRRRQLYPEYKQNRKMDIKLNRTYDFNTIEDEKDSIKKQLMTLMSVLEFLPLGVMCIDHTEADDIIAFLSEHIPSKYKGTTVIASADKDFMQLVNDNCFVYNFNKKMIFTKESVFNEYGVYPCNMTLVRAFEGDKSDNINGVNGIGQKTLLKNIPILSGSEYISEEKLKEICNLENNNSITYKKIRDGFNNGLIERNIKLMELKDVNISSTNKLCVAQIYENHVPTLQKFELTKFLISNKLMGNFLYFDDWISTSYMSLLEYGKN